MAFDYITLEQSDHLATLTLRRPSTLNALNRAMLREMAEALDQIREDGSIRALLITGEGRAFCSGADLVDAQRGDGDGPVNVGEVVEMFYIPVMERLHALTVPVVVAVNGLAAGAGCSLALAGDIVLSAQSAYFMLSFVHIGLVPDSGITWLLPRLAGLARAQAMMLLGEKISAEQAEAWGLIYGTVADDELLDAAQMVAMKLANGPTQAYRLIRQAVRTCLDSSYSHALWTERWHQDKASCSADFSEGVRAFLDRRPPAFTGV